MNEGVVRWFNYQKGYGFIECIECDKDVFIHHSEFLKEEHIHEGSKVTFEVVTGQKGLSAKDVALKK